MAYLLFEHEIEDFDRWKPVYDGHEPSRKRAGLREVLLLQSSENPRFVVLLFEVEDIKRARDFLDSDDIRDAMKRAGVVGKPVINFLNKAQMRKAA